MSKTGHETSNVQRRRRMLLVCVLTLVVVLSFYQAMQTARELARFPAPSKLIDVTEVRFRNIRIRPR